MRLLNPRLSLHNLPNKVQYEAYAFSLPRATATGRGSKW